jgi:hypothetical protein
VAKDDIFLGDRDALRTAEMMRLFCWVDSISVGVRPFLKDLPWLAYGVKSCTVMKIIRL